jgi:hypothetical protein
MAFAMTHASSSLHSHVSTSSRAQQQGLTGASSSYSSTRLLQIIDRTRQGITAASTVYNDPQVSSLLLIVFSVQKLCAAAGQQLAAFG